MGRQTWLTTWRLLAITLPLSIAGIALLGWSCLGLAPAVALPLGVVLAPTNPALEHCPNARNRIGDSQRAVGVIQTGCWIEEASDE